MSCNGTGPSRSTSSSGPTSRFRPGELDGLSAALAVRLEELVGELAPDLRWGGGSFQGACPVHGGSNRTAFQLYANEEGEYGGPRWACFSRSCQEEFGSGLLGFVRGALSRQRLGWSGPGDRSVTFGAAVDWACRWLGVTLAEIEVDGREAEQKKFFSRVAMMAALPSKGGSGMPREQVRARLTVPSPYYLRRGYLASTLDEWDVGDCTRPGRPFAGRAVVPVYDDEGLHALGFTARSHNEKCELCEHYHGPGPCPPARDAALWAKWRHSDGFEKSHHLFGWWKAKDEACRAGQLLLVESPGDVLRLWEAGLRNAVGLFGTSLSDRQEVALQCTGVREVCVLTNTDEAGRLAARRVGDRLKRLFSLRFPIIPTNDVGDLSAAEARSVLLPQLGAR